jgi:hypothetical protein
MRYIFKVEIISSCKLSICYFRVTIFHTWYIYHVWNTSSLGKNSFLVVG